MTKILDPETRKDPMKRKGTKEARIVRIKELIADGKSDMAAAIIVGCSWVEVKAVRSTDSMAAARLMRRTDAFRGMDVT